MNQTFHLSFGEGAQVALFYSYFLEERIRSESSMLTKRTGDLILREFWP